MIKTEQFVGQEIRCGRKSPLLENCYAYTGFGYCASPDTTEPYVTYERRRTKERDEMRFLACAALPRDDSNNDDDATVQRAACCTFGRGSPISEPSYL